MRRTTTQCKDRKIHLKLVHSSNIFDIHEFTVKEADETYQKATKDFKKAIDPKLSVRYTLNQ